MISDLNLHQLHLNVIDHIILYEIVIKFFLGQLYLPQPLRGKFVMFANF